MQLAPAGDRAVLVDLGEVNAEELHAAHGRIRGVAGVVDAIVGHSSLYVIFDGEPDRDALLAALRDTHHAPLPSHDRIVPVVFDGQDMDEFLAHVGLSRDAFLHRVDGLRLIARYLGFRGGFAYLDGWPNEWAMPRRTTSRPVARGSFAIAGNVAGFYPIDTPGGWNLLGRTDADLENRIEAGDALILRVRRELPISFHAPLSLITDNPFDDVAAALANRAVGNDANVPVLECAMAAPRVTFQSGGVIAWCTPDLEIRVEHVRAGEERAFGRIVNGLRGYLAIGLDCGDASRRSDSVRAATGVAAVQTRADRHVLRAMRGPHDVGLSTIECEVTPQLDRVGIRLRPLQKLDVKIPADLKSIGMQCGTVQLHPDGSLVAMGPDHPITGGYLQPMTLLSSERWKLAQLVPGERITLTTVLVP